MRRRYIDIIPRPNMCLERGTLTNMYAPGAWEAMVWGSQFVANCATLEGYELVPAKQTN